MAGAELFGLVDTCFCGEYPDLHSIEVNGETVPLTNVTHYDPWPPAAPLPRLEDTPEMTERDLEVVASVLQTANEWIERSLDIVTRSPKLGADQVKKAKRLVQVYERPLKRCIKMLEAACIAAAAASTGCGRPGCGCQATQSPTPSQ